MPPLRKLDPIDVKKVEDDKKQKRPCDEHMLAFEKEQLNHHKKYLDLFTSLTSNQTLIKDDTTFLKEHFSKQVNRMLLYVFIAGVMVGLAGEYWMPYIDKILQIVGSIFNKG